MPRQDQGFHTAYDAGVRLFRLVEREASIRYDGALVEATSHRRRSGYSCTYVVTGDGCRVGTGGTATVARPRADGRVTLEGAVTSFCDSG